MDGAERVKYKRLQEAVAEVLGRDWDPLGVAENPSLRDEYGRYVGAICRLLITRGDHEEISAYLRLVQHVDMGLVSIDTERDRKVADVLASMLI
jgi:hypothetical protein